MNPKIVSLSAVRERKQAEAASSEEDNSPHLSGNAVCLACKHEWVAVAPVGTIWFECPSCGTERGVMKGPCMHVGESHWTCKCGNILFHITKNAVYCPLCGKPQEGF